MAEQPVGPETPTAAAGSTISIIGLEDTGRQDRGMLKRPDDWRLGRSEVPLKDLGDRVNGFLESMRTVLKTVPEGFGEFQLDEVTVSAEISAKGQISLLGSGGEIAGKAGLTFTFTRRSAEDSGSGFSAPVPAAIGALPTLERR